MNKYTEQHIEEQLKQIASIEPSRDSVRRRESTHPARNPGRFETDGRALCS